MAIDHDQVVLIMAESLEQRIVQAHPELSPEILRDLLRFLCTFYRCFPPERIDNDLYVVAGDHADLLSGVLLNDRNGSLAQLIEFPAVVLHCGGGRFVLANESSLSVEQLGSTGLLIYHLSEHEEVFWANGTKIPVPRICTDARSQFAIPTFWTMEEALEKYREQRVGRASRNELKACFCERCLRWVQKPESKLRDSLWDYLRARLRGYRDTKREQNVDETHPVDIKVTWPTNATSLVEIKWLGKSFGNGSVTEFTEARAVKGAGQLQDYINKSEQEDHDTHFEGHLVVFDGRRRGIVDEASVPSPEDAFYYKDMEVNYPTEFSSDSRLNLRHRYFISPIV